MQPFLLAVTLAVVSTVLFLLGAPPAYADASTTVDIGWFASFFASYVVPSAATLVAFLVATLVSVVKKKWNLDIDANNRAALQTALTNAAGLLVSMGASHMQGKMLDVKNPLVAQAIKYVEDSAGGALAHFGLGPQDVALKLAAKLPAATAAAPAA